MSSIPDFSGIFNQIKGGSISNPLGPALNSLLSTIQIPNQAALTALASAQASALGVPAVSDTQIGQAVAAINSVIAQSSALLGHTNQLSGVDLSSNNTLSTIARTMQLSKTINGQSDCSGMLGAFGAITNAALFVAAAFAMVATIANFIKNIPANINAMLNQASIYAQNIINQLVADAEALAAAAIAVGTQALAQSLAHLFNDPCMGGVIASIAGQGLLDELGKFKSVVDNKKSAINLSIQNALHL